MFTFNTTHRFERDLVSAVCLCEVISIFVAIDFLAAIVDAFEWDQVLLVLSEQDEAVSRSARNIPGVLVLPVEGLNVYDILRHKNLVMTKSAVEAVTQRLVG